MPHKGPIEQALARRLAFMRAGTAHLSERVFPDGSIVEIRGNPMPGGGFVATFTDVTAFRRAEAELLQANETLEQRVGERTTLLEQAKREAEHANDAKSRFLAAIGHDLLQPLHAAHLFTDALAQQLAGTDHDRGAPRDAVAQSTLAQIRGALDSTTDLLTGLLDMSRLEAGGLVPERRASSAGRSAGSAGVGIPRARRRARAGVPPRAERAVGATPTRNCCAACCRTSSPTRCATPRAARIAARRAPRGRTTLRIEVHDTGPGHRARPAGR